MTYIESYLQGELMNGNKYQQVRGYGWSTVSGKNVEVKHYCYFKPARRVSVRRRKKCDLSLLP